MGALIDLVRRFVRDLLGFPRQFWVLVAGIFVYCGTAALAFPFEAIYLRQHLHSSMSAIGLVFGLVPVLLMPLQFWAGHLTDRVGRRPLIIVSAVAGVAWFVGFAYARSIWQVAALVGIDIVFGWPLFQTASNAMIADLLPAARRADGFSITRVAMNVGVVLGPAAAGIALGRGATFFQLFIAAALGCLVFGAILGLFIRESRPPSAIDPVQHVDEQGRSGYAIVLADRRFVLFCLVALLPVFVIGLFMSIFSVFIVDDLGVSTGTWGLLLALNAFIVAVVQFPLIWLTSRRFDPMLLLALASLLLGIGMGGAAFVTPLWPLVGLVVILSFGEVFLSPVAAAVVSDAAPEAIRGRYMGVWTVVWNGGACMGPFVMGFVIDWAGGRAAFAGVLAVGVAGAALFPLLRERRPPATLASRAE